jgi:hypothetical protein
MRLLHALRNDVFFDFIGDYQPCYSKKTISYMLFSRTGLVLHHRAFALSPYSVDYSFLFLDNKGDPVYIRALFVIEDKVVVMTEDVFPINLIIRGMEN